jgi:hypothetical protein
MCHFSSAARQTTSVEFRKMMSAATKLANHSLLDIHIITQRISTTLHMLLFVFLALQPIVVVFFTAR